MTLAALLWPLLAAPIYVLDLSERTELRLRSPGDGVDFEQVAGAELEMRTRRVQLSLEYEPRFSYSDLAYDPTIDLLHTGRLASEITFRRLSLTLSQDGSYGTRSFTSLTPTTYGLVETESGAQIVPLAANIRYVSSVTAGSLGYELSPRTDLRLSANYFVDGGLDDPARRRIPLIYGPRGQADYSYQFAARDTATTTVGAESLHVDTGSRRLPPRSDIVRAQEQWSHAWSRRTTSDLAAGAAYARVDPAPRDGKLFPVGMGMLSHVFPTGQRETLDLSGWVLVDVQVDRLTAVPDHRLTTRLDSTWTHAPYTVYGWLLRTDSLQPMGSNVLALHTGEVGMHYQWTQALRLEFGARAAYQTVGAPTTTSAALAADGFNWLIFVALQATAPPIRL